MKINKPFTVHLTKKHFLASDGYQSTTNCVLAVALKEKFPNANRITVGGFYANIDFQYVIMRESDITVIQEISKNSKFPIKIILSPDDSY